MDDKKFAGLLTFLDGMLLELIETNKKISPQEAATVLYSSQLFRMLEQEETKLWHLSANALYDLLEEELMTGTITYPEEA